VVIATLNGVRQTARAAALADVIRGVFRDATAPLPEQGDPAGDPATRIGVPADDR